MTETSREAAPRRWELLEDEDGAPYPESVQRDARERAEQWAAEAAQGALDDAQIAVLRKALDIGAISHDGDGWFAKEAGYDYDDAESTLLAARRILDRLAALQDRGTPDRRRADGTKHYTDCTYPDGPCACYCEDRGADREDVKHGA